MFLVTCGFVPIDFKDLLRRAAKQFPSQQAFAAALRIDKSRLSRALNKGDYPLNVRNCLKLAELSGESASEILRSARKVEIAELIERLYGRENHEAHVAADRVVLNAWHGIQDDQARTAMLYTMRQLAIGGDRSDGGSGEQGGGRVKTQGAARTVRSGRRRSKE
jgi:transcriptional regulator with XRE-family HTH domain